MSKVRLMIDIPEAVIDRAKGKDGLKLCDIDIKYICMQVANGTPITEGDLISRSALIKDIEAERHNLLVRGQTGAEHTLVHHCLPIIDNAPSIGGNQNE